MELMALVMAQRYTLEFTYWLVQYSGHAIDQELKVLWSMQATQKVAEEILWRRPISSLGDRIQYQDQK